MENTRLKIRDLPLSDQPRERCKRYGANALATTELLQLIVGCGYLDICSNVFKAAGSLNRLQQMTIEEVSAVDGIGEGGAIAIVAALELGRRLQIEQEGERYQIRSPQDFAALMQPQFGCEDQEFLVVVLLDTKNRVIEQHTVYKGSVDTALIRVSEVFKQAVRRNAPQIMLCHNHPSGDPTPSPEDLSVTEKIIKAGENLDIGVLDHIIVTRSRWHSIRENHRQLWEF